MSAPASRILRWQPQSARRAAAERAGLSPLQWRQLEQLVDAGGAWLPASATVPVSSPLSGLEATTQLEVLAERGLAECQRPLQRNAHGFRATEAGHALVMQTRV
jgi:hypothetical protein